MKSWDLISYEFVFLCTSVVTGAYIFFTYAGWMHQVLIGTYINVANFFNFPFQVIFTMTVFR